MVQKLPAGGRVWKCPSSHKARLFGWLVGLVLFFPRVAQTLRTEVVLGMKEEKFTPSGCDSPGMKIN